MPITPKFHLSQTTTHLIITIHIPHIRVSASTLEIVVDKSEFHFYSNPYLLHLNFTSTSAIHSSAHSASIGSGYNDNRNLVDDESICKEAKATYDPSKDNGTLVVHIWKEEEGIWDDLDLLGRLMMNKDYYSISNDDSTKNNSNKIQVLNSSTNGCAQDNDDDEQEVDEQTDKNNTTDKSSLEQDIQSCLRPHYGFLKMHHSIFIAFAREGLSLEMLEIPNPDHTLKINNEDYNHVREMRLEMENDKFCPNRYLGDLYISDDYNDEDADMTYIEAKNMIPHWMKHTEVELSSLSFNNVSSSTSTSMNSITNRLGSLTILEEGGERKNKNNANGNNTQFFTQEESLHLASIKADIPPLSQITNEQSQSLFLSLIDILYAYVYDHRITNGESTCESSWTIVMLSPTLSWLESYHAPYDTIDQVLRWSIRRALIYPYLRNFDMLSNLLIKDVVSILCGGRRVVLRCLLQIHKILDHSEAHYLFNKLFINQYICWMQLIDEGTLIQFANDMKEYCLPSSDNNNSVMLRSKRCLDLDLELIEENAFNNMDDESDNEDDSDDESDDNSSSPIELDPNDLIDRHSNRIEIDCTKKMPLITEI